MWVAPVEWALSNPGVETTRNKKSEGLKFQNSRQGFP